MKKKQEGKADSTLLITGIYLMTIVTIVLLFLLIK